MIGRVFFFGEMRRKRAKPHQKRGGRPENGGGQSIATEWRWSAPSDGSVGLMFFGLPNINV